MNAHKNFARTGQAGMTLIELTVVLLVLIGLAGLLLPYVSGFAQKTHDSTNADNLASLNATIQRFITQNNRAPDNLEALVNAAAAGATASGVCTGAAADAVYCGMLDTGLFTVSTTNFTEATSFGMAGIQTVYENDPDTANKTFASTLTTTKTIGCLDGSCVGQTLASVGCRADGTATHPAVCSAADKATHLAAALGGQDTDYDTACYTYYTLGVGDKNEMIGRAMSSAPVHFATNSDQGPLNNYNHYVAVFKVDTSDTAPCSTSTEAAQFVGAVMGVPLFPDNKLYGQAAGISFAYENQALN